MRGTQIQYVTHRVHDCVSKIDALDALKVALDMALGHEVTSEEVLDFINNERKIKGLKPRKQWQPTEAKA
jgi:hypothetical protein